MVAKIINKINFNLFNISNFYSILKKYVKLFSYKKTNITLGRWCHVGVPNCNHDVIMKKLDFANRDNTLSPFIKPEEAKIKHYKN